MNSYRDAIFIAALFMVIGDSWCYSIPFRRQCHDTSPECLKNTIERAIPLFAEGSQELGMEPLDPFVLKQINLSLNGINIRFMNGFARGLKTCDVDFARMAGDTIEMQAHCNLTIKGRYRSSGSLLGFPIDGDGISTIKCNKLRLHTFLKLGSIVKDGQTYLNIESSDVRHAYDGRVSYIMTNLFKDNPSMSKAVLNFMNENWLMIADQFGTPIVDYGVEAIMKNIRRFFEVVPLDEINNL